MRPLGWVGLVLVIAGAVVAAMGGVGYTKSRNQVEVGSFKIAAEERGLVPPAAGIAAIAIGAILIFVGRKQST